MLVDIARDGRRKACAASLVLRTVLAHGPIARVRLAQRTGLSPSAVTRQCAQLTELGLLTEVAEVARSPRAGRPQVPVDVATDTYVAFGIHIAHRFATLIAVDVRGRIQSRRRIRHVSGDPHATLTAIASAFELFRRSQPPHRVSLGLGVAIGGWVDVDKGIVVEHGSLGWYDVPVAAVLTELTGVPVRVDGHARALALAERLYGAGRRGGSLVHLFVGNVLDAAILTETGAHHGPRSAAGTVAHLPFGDPATRCACGRTGCLEAVVADWAIAGPGGSAVDLVDAAKNGDSAARRRLLRRARLLGQGAAVLFDVFNPELLVVTEPAVAELPECLDVLRSEVADRSHVCATPRRSIVPSSFSRTDVLGMAAGAVQLDAVISDPLSLPDLLTS